MSKNRIVLTLGVLLIVTPFLGFPIRSDNILMMVSGAVLILVAFKRPVRRHPGRRARKQVISTDTFTESSIPQSSVTSVEAPESPHEQTENQEVFPR